MLRSQRISRLATATAVVLLITSLVTADDVEQRVESDSSGPVATADWLAEADDFNAIEQTQFGGFFSPMFGQAPFVTPPVAPRSTSRSSGVSPSRLLASGSPAMARRRRLSRTPDMLGDSFLPPFQLNLVPQNIFNGLFANSQLAVAGGSGRSKIAEHNKALPVDRVYFNYNHFHDAAQRQAFDVGMIAPVRQSASVDRFTLGAERTILDGDASLELRLPFTSYPDLNTAVPVLGPPGRFRTDTGTVGNLSLVGKRLLINGEDLIVSAGLGMEFPTGADGSVTSGDTVFTVENESLFLQPFLAMTLDNGGVFIHSFLQLDIDLKGSPLTVDDLSMPGPSIGVGEIRQQTLLHWDTSAGMWLARSDDHRGITGIAAIAEFHLSSATSSAETVAGVVPAAGGPINFALTSPTNRFSAAYVTVGLHTEIGRDQTIRVAGVFPLSDGVNRFFDSELMVQVGRRY